MSTLENSPKIGDERLDRKITVCFTQEERVYVHESNEDLMDKVRQFEGDVISGEELAEEIGIYEDEVEVEVWPIRMIYTEDGWKRK